MSETARLAAQRAAAAETLRLFGHDAEAARLIDDSPAPDDDSQLPLRDVRFGAVLLALSLALGGLWFFVWRPPDFEVVASGFYANEPSFRPALGVDGEWTTEWVAPPDAGAWLEVRFAEPVDIDHLRLRNGWNPPYGDRAMRDVRCELYRGETLVASEELLFATLAREPEPVDVAIAGEEIDRIRVVAETWHGRGVALGELDWF